MCSSDLLTLIHFMTETYTIIQRTKYDTWQVIDSAEDLDVAATLAAHYCDAAGVARTLVLNSFGTCVCVES